MIVFVALALCVFFVGHIREDLIDFGRFISSQHAYGSGFYGRGRYGQVDTVQLIGPALLPPHKERLE